MTVSELFAGVHRSSDAGRRTIRETFVETVLGTFRIFPFDGDVTRVHSSIWAELASTGRIIGANDLIIAATALSHGLIVFTDNVRDFNRVPGLTILQPDWSRVF